jgi:heat shock protein beta
LLVFSFICGSKKEEENFSFEADVSKVMNIIINSLYSNKDIFLRELISNAADALTKVRFLSLTNKTVLGTGDSAKLDIRIIVDEEAKTVTIIDRGIGMSRQELIDNLGTIAHSGTQRFLDSTSNGTEAVDVIGQFGVGFYSSFLVAQKVKVVSKPLGGGPQHVWVSSNAQSFEVSEDKSGVDLVRGTKIILYLRDSTYANTSRIRDLAMHYSEFVDFPIYVRVPRDSKEAKKKREEEEDEDEDEEEAKTEPSYVGEDGTVYDFVHVNAQKAIWLRDQRTITDDDYIHFYRSITRDYKETPIHWSHFSAEGEV